MTLFCKSKDPYDELWNGARTGLEGARTIFGADEVRRFTFPSVPPPLFEAGLTLVSASLTSRATQLTLDGASKTS